VLLLCAYRAKHTMSERVYLERDYRDSLITRFDDSLPDSLRDKVSEAEFRQTIDTINELFRQADRYTAATCLESMLGCLSCFTIYHCYDSMYIRAQHEIERFIEQQNQTVYHNKGLRWRNPFRNGLLHVWQPPSPIPTMCPYVNGLHI
jgi:hypothetical protein